MLEFRKDGISLTTFENKKLDTNFAISNAKLQSKFLSTLLESKPELIKPFKQSLKKRIMRSHIESFIKGSSIDNLNDIKKSLRAMREQFFSISLNFYIKDIFYYASYSFHYNNENKIYAYNLIVSYIYLHSKYNILQ